MADEKIMTSIRELIEEEHELLSRGEAAAVPETRQRLAAIEEGLDQCWDLLRQRRARRGAHQDESLAQPRPVDAVEHYQQ
ncbi:MAG TPA: DUF2630 family protein [Mycobacteriales bacterium]|nr:DUF2630 family protein [Mycobacteriales bacterium]